jgi:hypothetical protein
MMFTIRYMHPLFSTTVFKVTGGGRIYVHSINGLLIPNGGTILDVVGSDMNNGFFQINGLTGDGRTKDYHVLKNDDSSNGLQCVRFTNAHLLDGSSTDPLVAQINIAGGTGQTLVEFVGCIGLADNNRALFGNVLIVRDSAIGPASVLIDTANSSDYSVDGVKNWTFGAGVTA